MRNWSLGAVFLVAGVAAACGSGDSQGRMTGPAGGSAFMAVSPAPGATGVSVDAPITLRFSAAMASGMEQYVDLHVGNLSGATVPMDSSWSGDRLVLTCRPRVPLKARTTYAIHMGGGMMGADGSPLDYAPGQAMGGQWIMGGMMSGTHAGMGWGMMGSGWRNPNGSYGMVFSFTTT